MVGVGGHTWNPSGSLNPAWKGGFLTDRDWLYKRYVDEQLSLQQIAALSDRSLRTVARWMGKHEIPTRTSRAGKILRALRGSLNPRWNPEISGDCVECGKPMSRRLSRPQRCADCYDRAKKGSGNPNYRGLADVTRLVRAYSDRVWRSQIYERDNYICQGCGYDAGGILNAHHIRLLSDIIRDYTDRMPIETAEDRLRVVDALCTGAEVNNLNNGITLCESCHLAEHRKVGGILVEA